MRSGYAELGEKELTDKVEVFSLPEDLGSIRYDLGAFTYSLSLGDTSVFSSIGYMKGFSSMGEMSGFCSRLAREGEKCVACDDGRLILIFL